MKTAASAPGRPLLRVLYVEDNRLNALLFAEVARLHGGVELEVVETGADALALVASWQPSLLVLDAHLPDTDGHALLAELRGRPGLADTPAYMCSADAAVDDVERSRRAGFVGHWGKPIDLARVMADLDSVASQRANGA